MSKVRIRYRANCGDNKMLSSGVVLEPPFDVSTTKSFADGGPFSFKLPNDERAKATARVHGGLRQSGRWTGNFHVRVRITRNGRFVTNCRSGRIGWRARPV